MIDSQEVGPGKEGLGEEWRRCGRMERPREMCGGGEKERLGSMHRDRRMRSVGGSKF